MKFFLDGSEQELAICRQLAAEISSTAEVFVHAIQMSRAQARAEGYEAGRVQGALDAHDRAVRAGGL